MNKNLINNIIGVKMQFTIAGLVVFATPIFLNITRHERNF